MGETGNSFFWRRIEENKETQFSWIWPMIINAIQSLNIQDKSKIFEHALNNDEKIMWITKFNEYKKYGRKAPGLQELVINYNDIDELMNDLFVMWLDGVHDKYITLSFKQYLEDRNSYLRILKLIPVDLINEVIRNVNSGLISDYIQNIILASNSKINITNSDIVIVYGTFEAYIKKNLNMITDDANYIYVAANQGIKVERGRYLPTVTIDQEGDFKNITSFLSRSAKYLEPASLAEQLVDPGSELITNHSSLSVIKNTLTNKIKGHIALYYDRPRIKFMYKNVELYSVQLTDISQRARARSPNFVTDQMFQYMIKSSNVINPVLLDVGMSKGGAIKTVNNRTRETFSAATIAKNKFAKLLGDRMQILAVLFYTTRQFGDVILASGDTCLFVQYVALFNIINNKVNKKTLTFIFDTSRKYICSNLKCNQQNVNNTRINENKQIIFYGDANKYKLLDSRNISTTLIPRASTRSDLLKSLRKNIFYNNFNKNNSLIKNNKYNNLNKIIRNTRGKLRTIRKISSNYKQKINNIQKSNCNSNGNFVHAPRRRAQKNLTHIAFVNKLYQINTANHLKEYITNYILTKPLPNIFRQQHKNLYCGSRNKEHNIERNLASKRILGSNAKSSISSGTNRFNAMNNNNEVLQPVLPQYNKKSKIIQIPNNSIPNLTVSNKKPLTASARGKTPAASARGKTPAASAGSKRLRSTFNENNEPRSSRRSNRIKKTPRY